MNERIAIELRLDGRRLPIDALNPDGIVIRGEKDAFPRWVRLGLVPTGAAMKTRVRWLRSLKGWAPNEWKLTTHLENGRILLAGTDPQGLPDGPYTVRLEVEGLKARKPKGVPVTVPAGGTGKATIEVSRDSRDVSITVPVEDMDAKIAAVLQAPESRLDTLPVAKWLQSPRPRAARKACLFNVLAKARVLPSRGNSLCSEIRDVFFAATDRVFVSVTPNLLARLTELSATSDKFFDEGAPHAGVHRKLLDRVLAMGIAGAGTYDLRSFRVAGSPSLQLVIAYPGGQPQAGPQFADMDLDLGNPLADVAGFVVHMGEIANPGRTDHLKLRKALYKGPTKPFIYYKVLPA